MFYFYVEMKLWTKRRCAVHLAWTEYKRNSSSSTPSSLKKYSLKCISLGDWAIHTHYKQRFLWLHHTAQPRRKINCIYFICIGGYPVVSTQTYSQVIPPLQQTSVYQLGCSSYYHLFSVLSKCKIILLSSLRTILWKNTATKVSSAYPRRR